MRILVTGGAGFIGSNFVRRVLDQTFPGISSVTVLDKMTYAGVMENLADVLEDSRLSLVIGDICDSKIIEPILSEIDAVVNFAAESHVDRSIASAAAFVKTNIEGVQVLLDCIKNSSRGIRFLQVSTDEVYGSIDSGSWNENCPLLPNSPYSATKAGGELLARSYHRTHGLDVVITRSSNNYGPYHFPEKLIPLFITNIMEGKELPIYGNGKNIRDWLHVDDHCQGIYLVLMKGISGEVYNIGGNSEFSNLEITHKILNIMGTDETYIRYIEDRKGHDLRYSVDWTKIKRELGFEPQINFELGLVEVVNWYQTNQAWWMPLKKRAGL